MSSTSTQGQNPTTSIGTQALSLTYACPQHGLNTQSGQHNRSPMGRFLAEGPTEQSALFIRPDTGKLSISKGCTCGTSTTAN